MCLRDFPHTWACVRSLEAKRQPGTDVSLVLTCQCIMEALQPLRHRNQVAVWEGKMASEDDVLLVHSADDLANIKVRFR